MSLADALGKTMYLLAHTRNQAAVPVLVSALGSKHSEIRLGAIHGLVLRRNSEGHAEILARVSSFNDLELATLAESIIRSSHHMQDALHTVFLEEDLTLCENACRVIVLGRVYQMLPTLIQVAENSKHRHSAQALATLVQLARLLHEESYVKFQDRTCEPALIRRQVLPAFEQSLARFRTHQRLEIVDAFLLLVPPMNETLLNILSSPAHSCYRPVVNSLKTSAQVPILELLAQLLHDTKIPDAALKIIAERYDRKFIDYLLHAVGSPPALRVQENFKKLHDIAWLSQGSDVLFELDGAAQSAAVSIAVESRLDRAQLLMLLKLILDRGQPEGRRASCQALADFRDRNTTLLVIGALADPDPRVQAAAVRQLRRRAVPDGMERLLTFLDHPAPEVRDAVRESLPEFGFARYRAAFETMSQATRKKVGKVVMKVDPDAPRRLAELLAAPSPTMKLRALEMVVALDAADTVLEELAPLIADPDVAVRVEAAGALGTCQRVEAAAILEDAADDDHLSVREAATIAIEQLADNVIPCDTIQPLDLGEYLR